MTQVQAEQPEALPVPQAARRVGVSTSSLWRAIYRNEVPVIRIGARVVVPNSVLDDWLAHGNAPMPTMVGIAPASMR